MLFQAFSNFPNVVVVSSLLFVLVDVFTLRQSEGYCMLSVLHGIKPWMVHSS